MYLIRITYTWAHIQDKAHDAVTRKEPSKQMREQCPTLAQSQKWCLLPPSECKNIIHRILSRTPRKLMAQ